MIKTFKDKGLEQFAATGNASALSVTNHARVRRILRALDAAIAPQQMNVPGNRFHGLQGNRKGTYAVDVNGNWRITFRFDGQDAIDVNLEDYH